MSEDKIIEIDSSDLSKQYNDGIFSFTGRVIFDHRNEGFDIGYNYYKNGKYHREDGPAIKFAAGQGVRFYLEGVAFDTKEEWFSTLSEEQKMKALYNIDEWR